MMGRAVALGVASAAAIAPGVATADPSHESPRTENAPVALNGPYVLNRALDRQTFNGSPAPGTPFSGDVDFSTACDGGGCVAHSTLAANGVSFDFNWTGGAWRSVQHFDWTCGDQSAPATVTYTLAPDSNGTLTGTEIAVVSSPGCGSARVPGTVVSPLTGVPG